MKKISQQLAIIGFAVLSTLACAQKTENTVAKTDSQKSTAVAGDSKATDEQKKAAAEEKAKLAKPYNPKANAEKDLEMLMAKAKKENKNIMIQAGGNWCIWCLRFNNFVMNDPKLKAIVDKNYEYYHLNYSPENKNEKVFAKYGNPGEKFGYPVFIILDSKGEILHVQSSEILEEGKGYSKDRVSEFLSKW
jgi:thioredoxin-related protein